MTQTGKKVLVFGFGNPGRLDDGLGPRFAEEMEKRNLAGVTIDSNYQLSVEDAAAIAEHDYVVFVDAHVSCSEPFLFNPVVPKAHTSFSSHSISAEALMAMASDLLSSNAKAFILGIRGYEFNEFGERISRKAEENLQSALDFLTEALKDGNLESYTTDSPEETEDEMYPAGNEYRSEDK